MKHIKKFNESTDKIELSMHDVSKIQHNLGYKNKNDFMKNYRWKEDQILVAKKGYLKPEIWDGKKIEIYDLFTKDTRYASELGYAVLVDDEIKYLIGIYEPHGCSLNAKRGLVTAHGHEDIVQLWLDDGEFETTHTR